MDGGAATELRRARNRLITRRLPRFAALWLPATLVWCGVLHLEGVLGLPAAVAGFAAQAIIVAAALLVCRAEPGTPRVFRTVMTMCVLLGVTTIGLFVPAGGSGDFLAFTLLTLYLLAALLFTWGWRAELGLL